MRAAMPVRWTAPEALDARTFSAASDAFAFGITLYEIWTDAAFWLEQPEGARARPVPPLPVQVYNDVILPCWQAEPEDRPQLAALTVLLEDLVDQPGCGARRRQYRFSYKGYYMADSRLLLSSLRQGV